MTPEEMTELLQLLADVALKLNRMAMIVAAVAMRQVAELGHE